VEHSVAETTTSSSSNASIFSKGASAMGSATMVLQTHGTARSRPRGRRPTACCRASCRHRQVLALRLHLRDAICAFGLAP
jgi:hypothetical protein